MRIPSGKTDQVIYFVAVDSTDLKTRETGLSSFTVYRSRKGGAATAYTTPTVAELSAANMPGVYALTVDEDTTIDSGSDSEEYCVHITQASMAPVTRTIELYRRDTTSGQTITVANGAADADIERLQGSVIATPTTAGVLEVDVTHWLGTAAATPTVAGVPEVDITHIAGAAVSATTAQLGVNVVNINNNLSSAQKLQQQYTALAAGTSDSGTTTTMVDAARTEGDTDYFKGMVILFTSGVINGQSRMITGFNAATDTITFSPATTQAVSTQTYIIFPGQADVEAWLGTVPATPTVAGVPAVETIDISAAGQTDIRSAVGLASANLDTQLSTIDDFLDTEIAAIKAKTDQFVFTTANRVDAQVFGMQADTITSSALATSAVDEVVDGVWDEQVDGTTTARQSIRLANSANGGKLSGAGTTAIAIRDLADTKNRVAATVDASGNRSAITLDVT